jgi:enoyl-CoA hydratase / 3-hydroxyacyl-CoA dehydrogenase
VVPDQELFDSALAWATKLSGQAPVAAGEIKNVSHAADLDEGLAAEGAAFGRAFGSEDAKEGISAFLGKRRPKFQGR